MRCRACPVNGLGRSRSAVSCVRSAAKQGLRQEGSLGSGPGRGLRGPDGGGRVAIFGGWPLRALAVCVPGAPSSLCAGPSTCQVLTRGSWVSGASTVPLRALLLQTAMALSQGCRGSGVQPLILDTHRFCGIGEGKTHHGQCLVVPMSQGKLRGPQYVAKCCDAHSPPLHL